jgi:hypothetical protein
VVKAFSRRSRFGGGGDVDVAGFRVFMVSVGGGGGIGDGIVVVILVLRVCKNVLIGIYVLFTISLLREMHHRDCVMLDAA